MQGQQEIKRMNLVQLTFIVAVNMMGSGIIMLPTNMAQVGAISLLSWIVTALGSMAIAYGFAQAGLFNQRPGGMSAYAEDAYGKSGYFLWPLGILMLMLAALYSPAMPRFWRGILAAWGVRIGFVFVAIGLPSLFDTIIKNMIGRARPFVVAGPDVWAYEPFTWHPRYASFPSGHATTAFAALVAIGAIFPQARALMWIYAVLIALSRVVITAHHPSDVIGGAIVGAVGAVMVRNWFAARRLGFSVAADGSVRAMPGPSFRRIIKAVARRLHSA